MQASTDKLVRGTVVLRDAEGNMVRFSTSTANAGQSAAAATTSFGQMASKLAAMAVTLGVVTKVQQFATESFSAGRAQNDLRNALLTVVGSMSEYNKLIEAGRASTKGMLSETELAQAGMVLLKSGIAGTSEEVGKLAAAGTALVNTYAPLGASQEKLTRFILSGNRALLDNFNFTTQQVQAMQRHIEATTNLTGAEAAMAARKALVIQEGEKLLGTVSNETVQVQQLTAAYNDFQASFGQVLIALNNATGLIPGVTAGFQKLTEGAKAWEFVISEAIPAIDAHNASLAAQAAQAAINAQSQAELDAAWQQGRADFDTFRSALIAGTDSAEEYNDIIKRGAQGNYLLVESLVVTTEEFDNLKTSSEQVATVQDKLTEQAGVMASTYGDVNSTLPATIAGQLKLADAVNTAALAFGGQVDAMVRANQLALATATNMRPAIDAMAGAFGGQQDPFSQSLNTARLREAENMRLEAIERDQKAREDAAKELERLQREGVKSMSDAFNQVASDIRSTIESVIKPTLGDVWTPPEGAISNFDENARRLATVATAGFGSEWLTQLNAQFAGMDFWQPITAAMQGGDVEALKQAANNILINNVTALWDVEQIKSQVRQQLEQQKLREQIITEIQNELMAEGGISEVVPTAVDVGLEGFEQQLPDFLPPWQQTFDDMEEVVNEKDWAGLGKSIDDGILKGIRDNKHKILEELKDLAKEALRAAEDELGAHSPATAFIPLGQSIDEGIHVGILSKKGLIQDAYDQLFNIDRDMVDSSILETSRVAGAALDDVEKFFDAEGLEGSKTNLALDLMKKVFNENSAAILSATDRAGTFFNLFKKQYNIQRIFGRQPGGIIARGFGEFMMAFDDVLAERNEIIEQQNKELQQAIISGSHSALSFAGSLADLATSGAAKLNSEVDMLAQLLNTGASEFMLDGKLVSAAEATDLLNQKMQEQADIQDDLLQLQQSQAQLAFLEKQLSLIETINKAGLNPADVLGGADLSTTSGLVAATNAAIQAIIGQVGQDIGAISPLQGSQTVNNSSAANFYAGGITINNGMDINTLRQFILRTVAQGIG